MRCVSTFATPVDAIIVSNFVTARSIPSISAGPDPFPIVALDRALDREHFTSVVGADQDDAEMFGGRAA